MAPVRRYLRISKYSVLECRIYLDNPALAQTWLLNTRNPVLPRVIEAIRPLVLPKLREETERAKKKGSKKKKQIKDVIEKEDFEVSMFLVETSTRHSLLTKHKHLREKIPGKLQSNSKKLIGETNASPVDVDDEVPHPVLREEDSEDAPISMAAIPEAKGPGRFSSAAPGDDDRISSIMVNSDDEDEPAAPARPGDNLILDSQADPDDKKKLAMDVTYEGFAIYGRVLCLVVKKKDPRLVHSSASGSRNGRNKGSGQARMENWISSTQIPVGEDAF